MADPAVVRAIVQAATRAPSVHNTQPWRFVAHDDVLEVWTDPGRGLPVLDPHGRARHLSCGAALGFAQVAAAARGRTATATLLPAPDQPEHVADLLLTEGGPADPVAEGLARAIDARHTDRGAFDEAVPVTATELHLLAEAAQSQGCWLRAVESPADVAALRVLLARADDVQSADPAYTEELRRWTGRGDDSADGVPASAVPGDAPRQRGSSFRLRDFDPDREDTGPRWGDDPPPAEHPVVVVLGTPDDRPADWLAAGQGLARLLLTATGSGLAASPMTQALEVEDTRARLVRELGLVGHPQVVLRVGRPVAATEPAGPADGHAHRRSVDEVLETR